MRRKIKKAYAIVSLPARIALGCVIMSVNVVVDTANLILDKDIRGDD